MSSSVPNQTKLSVLTYVSSNNSAHRSSPSVNAQPDKDASNEPLFATACAGVVALRLRTLDFAEVT